MSESRRHTKNARKHWLANEFLKRPVRQFNSFLPAERSHFGIILSAVPVRNFSNGKKENLWVALKNLIKRKIVKLEKVLLVFLEILSGWLWRRENTIVSDKFQHFTGEGRKFLERLRFVFVFLGHEPVRLSTKQFQAVSTRISVFFRSSSKANKVYVELLLIFAAAWVVWELCVKFTVEIKN